jgi:excisionase family DNA binding protein
MTSTIITAGITPAELLEQVRAILRYELQQAGVSATVAVPETSDLLTVQQAAELLDVGVHTIHCWKKAGRLPYLKMGSRTYFKRAALLGSLQNEQRSVKKGGRTRA